MADMRVFDYEQQRWIELRGRHGALLTSTYGPPETESLLAAASGSEGGLGRIGQVPQSGTLIVRCDCSDDGVRDLWWRVSSSRTYSYQFALAREKAGPVTLTCSSLADEETLTINGQTLTAEDTEASALYSANLFWTGDTGNTEDAEDLAKLISGGTWVKCATVVADDEITLNGQTFTAAAAEDLAAGEFAVDDDTTAATSLAACINHKDNVTLVTVAAGETLTVNGLTYTAHADTTTADDREFSIAGTDAQDAAQLVSLLTDKSTVTLESVVDNEAVSINGLTFTGKTGSAVASERRFSVDTGDTEAALSLVACINDATYGVPGVTAESSLGVVTLTPDYGTTITLETTVGETITCHDGVGVPGVTAEAADAVITFSRDSALVPAIEFATSKATDFVIETANGIPGLTAAARGVEVDIVSDWGEDIVVSTEAATMSWGTYGIPGVSATADTGVVSLEMTDAPVIQAATGTAGGHLAVAYTSMLSELVLYGATVSSVAANSSYAGAVHVQTVNGWEQAYIIITEAGAGAATVSVAATKVR